MALNIINTVLFSGIIGALIGRYEENQKGKQPTPMQLLPAPEGNPPEYTTEMPPTTEVEAPPEEIKSYEQTDDEKVKTIKGYLWWVDKIRLALNSLNSSSRSTILYILGQGAKLYSIKVDQRDLTAFWKGDYDPLLNAVLSIPNEQIEAITWNIRYAQKPIGTQDIDYDKIERALETLRGKLLLPFTLFQFLETNNIIKAYELKIYLDDFNKPDSAVPHVIVMWLQTRIPPTP